eukprot:13628429-Alexandrium_andersonii.AAC.1
MAPQPRLGGGGEDPPQRLQVAHQAREPAKCQAQSPGLGRSHDRGHAAKCRCGKPARRRRGRERAAAALR